MLLKLQRDKPSSDCTLGKLFVDDSFACYTCEDVERPNGEKVHGKTAIPRGKYRVIVTPSQRFKRDLPLLVDVPNFAGIRIHPGNTAAETEGCILPGRKRLTDRVMESRAAFSELFENIERALERGEDVFIEIVGS